MRLRDFSILIMIAGIFMIAFTLMISDSEIEDSYGSLASHADEHQFNNLIQSINSTADTQRLHAAELQDKLKTEDEISLLTVGTATIQILKDSLSFSYLNDTQSISSEINTAFGIPPAITALIFAIFVIVIVFTVIGAILRWRT